MLTLPIITRGHTIVLHPPRAAIDHAALPRALERAGFAEVCCCEPLISPAFFISHRLVPVAKAQSSEPAPPVVPQPAAAQIPTALPSGAAHDKTSGSATDNKQVVVDQATPVVASATSPDVQEATEAVAKTEPEPEIAPHHVESIQKAVGEKSEQNMVASLSTTPSADPQDPTQLVADVQSVARNTVIYSIDEPVSGVSTSDVEGSEGVLA